MPRHNARDIYKQMKARGGMDVETKRIVQQEIDADLVHYLPAEPTPETQPISLMMVAKIASGQIAPSLPLYRTLRSLDELLERDNQREKDGFKRKINLGKVIKPVKGGSRKVVIVPTTSEDKFYHDSRVSEDDEDDSNNEEENSGDTGETSGSAQGEEGDVIGERPLDGEGEGGSGAGGGGGDEHELGSSAYELGKILTEKFQLPNLKEKGKKPSLTKFVYDLTDTNRGSGQVLDKHRTLAQILKTNINLGRIHAGELVDPTKLLINPRDYIYRVMSREKDVEAQAVLFFLRDYSGSMYGKPTELVCSQHVMIYSWLMYQYKGQVDTRFIVHDTSAKEIPDFYTYHNINVAGGTEIRSAFSLVNKIVEEENLATDYNIYIFYGGDGDDWNSNDKAFVSELKKTFTYLNRLGITIVQSAYAAKSGTGTKFERFLKQHAILDDYPKLVRLDLLQEDATDNDLVNGIKYLVS